MTESDTVVTDFLQQAGYPAETANKMLKLAKTRHLYLVSAYFGTGSHPTHAVFVATCYSEAEATQRITELETDLQDHVMARNAIMQNKSLLWSDQQQALDELRLVYQGTSGDSSDYLYARPRDFDGIRFGIKTVSLPD